MAEQDKHGILPTPSFDKPVKLLIVAAPFYRAIADNLIAGAKAGSKLAKAQKLDVDVLDVEGFEALVRQ